MSCFYTLGNASDHVADTVASPTKRRHLDTSPPSIHSALESSDASPPQAYDTMPAWDQARNEEQQHPGDLPMSGVTATQPPLAPGPPAPDPSRQAPFPNVKKLPSRKHANGLSEETNIYTETRMLQDGTGRLREYPAVSPFCDLCLTSSPSSLPWRRIYLVHLAADSHHCREYCRVRRVLALYR